MEYLISFALQTVSCLIGLLMGTLAALAIDRHKKSSLLRQRAKIILRSLQQELELNYHALVSARPEFRKTTWGKSFYISTSAWDTALSAADLPSIIGYRLSDTLSDLYGSLVRVRHYLNLLTDLWMASRGIEGYESIQRGFHSAICEAMDEVLDRYSQASTQVRIGLEGPPKSCSRDRRQRLSQEYVLHAEVR